MKNELFISGNIFTACGLLLIGFVITVFQSQMSLYRYLSQFTTVDHQAQISLNTGFALGCIMVIIGIIQVITALHKSKQ